ncbi:MAG: lipopolysaccharide biosynthesis protein [Spirochaetales bacterium]|nr:lipopolysaccharide biosynthesis protein [Spirochaetales bacterium]
MNLPNKKSIQNFIFPLLDILLNGLNYLFHVYVSWYLTAEKYGEFNGLLSFGAILLVTGISFQVTTARQRAAAPEDDRIFQEMAGTGMSLLGILLALLLALSPLIRNLTRSSLSSVLLILLIFALNLILSLYRGMMQGEKRFLLLNLSFYIEVIAKTLLLLLLIPRFRSINSGLFALGGGMFLALVHSVLLYGKEKKGRTAPAPKRLGLSKKVLSLVAAEGSSQFALYFFTSLDMILVNYFLAEQSGVYAVVLKYGQLLFFVSFSILTVFIPHLSEKRNDRPAFLRLTRLCALLLSAICALSLLFYWKVFPPTVGYFFDDQYGGAAAYLLWGGLSYAFLVLSFMVVNFILILNRRDFIPILFAAALILPPVLIFFLRKDQPSLRTLLISKGAIFALLAVVLTAQFWHILRKEPLHEP